MTEPGTSLEGRSAGSGALVGRTVSHYRILGLLGVGGMGEVYRAEDTDLRRQVAFKVLPARMSADPERLERFKREARSLAALNHPNIVTVFSIETVDGLDFLTMELIEGRTLAELIPKNGLPIDRFFEYAIPLVEAISAAHAAGIVHRDLKPSNVMVTREGRVKVLDFGLAKYRPAGNADGGSAYTTEGLTSDHRVLGTLAYMSPEQLQGQQVDTRSDIFSLGVVLFQMATGKRPFSGSSSFEILSSVLKDKVPSATDVRPTLPPHLARILRRCLNKDHVERHQSAADLRHELEELREELETGEAVSSAIEVVRPPRRGRRLLAQAGVAMLAAVALFALWRPWEKPPKVVEEAQIAVPAITWPSEEREGRISPDGQWLSFISDRDGGSRLWIRRLEGGEPRVLSPDGRTILSHAWSPAGVEIAVLVNEAAKRRVEIIPAPLGGSPRLNLEVSELDRIVGWVSDNVYLKSPSSLWGLELTSGELSEIQLPRDGFEFLHQFEVSADGGTVLFSALRDAREDIWRFDTRTGDLEALTRDGAKATFPHCADPGCTRVVYLSNRTGQTDVWIAEPHGSRQMKVATQVEAIDDASLDGSSVVLQVLMEVADLWHWDDRSGSHTPLTVDSLADFGVSPAADTSVIAFQRARPARDIQSRFLDAQVILADLQDGRLTGMRLLADGYAPSLSPDGRRVAFLRMAATAPYFTELWVGDGQSGQTMLLSDRFQMTGFWEWPADLLARNVVWSGADQLLWTEAGPEGIPSIGRAVFAQGPPKVERISLGLESGTLIQDLSIAADAGGLDFVSRSPGKDLWAVQQLRWEAPPETLYNETISRGSLRLLGAMPGAVKYLLRTRPTLHEAEEVELLALTAEGSARVITAVHRAHAATARFDVGSGRVWIAADWGGAFNILALKVDSGEIEQITDNRLPGITYCGMGPLGQGGLVYSRHQRNFDLWLLRRDSRLLAGIG